MEGSSSAQKKVFKDTPSLSLFHLHTRAIKLLYKRNNHTRSSEKWLYIGMRYEQIV